MPTAVLNEGNNDVQVMVTGVDASGNTAIAVEHQNVVLDTQAHNVVAIDTVAGDNTVNASESRMPTFISGNVTGDAQAGDHVVVSVNGHDYNGVVMDNNGHLTYEVPLPDGVLHEGSNDVQVMVTGTDNAGNTAISTAHQIVMVDTQAQNSITIDTVATDNVVNASESRMPTLISGEVSGDAQVGDHVVVSVNGHDFNGQVVVDANGQLRYEVPVPTAALNEGNNDVQVMVTGVDASGNTAIAVEHKTVVLDTQAHNVVTIDTVAGDNTVNASESRMPTMISGVVSGDAQAGDHVVVSVNGHEYHGDVVADANGQLRYEVPVPTAVLNEGSNNVQVMVTGVDASGNTAIAVEHKTVVLDTQAHNAVTIDTVAGDNIVNAHEGRMPTFISGNVSGDAQAGDHVVVSVNGHDYNGVVMDNNGHLTYAVPLPDGVLHEGSNDVQVMVTGVDASGNTAIAVDHKTVTVDTQANNTVTINDATSDNILNHTELGHRNQTITGVVGGDAKIGDEVTLEINGHDYRGRVVDMGDGKHTLGYKIPVPSTEFGDNNTILNKDVSVKATLVSHDAAGNEAIAVSEHTIHVDNHAYNGVTINTVAGDNVVNAGESKHETLVTGRITGKDAHIGDAVDVTIGTTTVHGTIFSDPQGHLYYEAKIPTGVLKEGNNDVTVKVTSHDAAHNEAVATEHTTITLDTHADATIAIDSVTKDNILNHDELNAAKQFVNGEVGGDARIGDKVSIEIGVQHFGGQVIDLGNGKLGYHIAVPPSAFSDNQGSIHKDVTFTATVTSHDAAGNEVNQTANGLVHIDNFAEAGITMDLVSGDNTINQMEYKHQQTTKVTGTVTGVDVHQGDKVIVTVNGHQYETTVEPQPQLNGALGYSLEVKNNDLGADGTKSNLTAHVVGHDSVGNEQLAEVTTVITVDRHAEATITIDKVTGDNWINGKESQGEFTKVTGTVGGDAKQGDLVTLHVNGLELTGRVDANHHYSIDVSTYDLMKDPNLKATITVTDQANNVAKAEADQHVNVDTQVEATISVDSVTPDNTLNGEELNHHYTLVSGKVTGEMNVGDPLTLKVNGHEYHGTVETQADGSMGYNILVETTDIHQDPNIHASIDVTDTALNHTVATADHHVHIDDHAAASLTINIVSGDDILNGLDQTSPTTTINGRVGGEVEAGDTVDITVDGKVYHATVGPQSFLGGGLGYSQEVPTQGLLNNPHITATVSIEDGAHNTVTAGTTHDVSSDDHATATITIDRVTDDNTINNAEAHNPHTTITGHVTGDVHAGDQVDLTVNGQHYYGSVSDKGRYSIDVSTNDLLSGDNKPVIHASVTGSDAAGNTVLAEGNRIVNIDTRAEAGIDIHHLGLDAGNDFWVIDGHVTGDAKEGDVVTIHAGTKTFTTNVIVLADGKLGFSSHDEINGHDLDINAKVTVEITSTDPHGNTYTARADSVGQGAPWPINTGDHTGGTTTPPQVNPPHVDITISPIAGNDVINKVELEAGHTVIRGTVHGDVHPGDEVTLHIGKDTYTGHVVELPNLPGEFGYEIPVDTTSLLNSPDITALVTGHNGGGSQEFTVSKDLTIDTDVKATIQLDNIAGDNVINIAESKTGTTTVTGTVTGDGIKDGSNVTIMVNGHAVTTQVHTDSNGDLRFSKEVSIDDLRQSHDITVSVTGHDDQGNSITVSDGKTVAVDTEIKATVSIDKVTDDNILNFDESKQGKTAITGHVTGDVNPGEHVTLHVNGVEYKDVEIDKNLNYTVDVNTSDLRKGDTITAEVTGHDDAGNSIVGTATHHYSIDTNAEASITIHTVSGDNILSAKDLSATQTEISGTVGKDAAPGDQVTVILNGVPTSTTVIPLPGMNGQLGYSLKVQTADLKAELEAESKANPGTDPAITVTVTGTDDAGNAFSQSENKTVTIDDHADVTLTFDNVTADNVINLAESHNPTTEISGRVTGDVKENDIVTVTVNGNDLPATLHKDSSGGFTFKVNVSTSELQLHHEITYKVTGTDDVGNTVTRVETNTITVDKDASNTIHLDAVAGDDKVNIVESHSTNTILHGVVTGDVIDGKITVELNGAKVSVDVDLKDVVISENANGEKTFEIPVATNLLHEGANNVVITVTGHDLAGNPATSTDTHNITLDTTIGAHITLNSVATDDVINAAESDHVSVTGTVTPDGDAKLGDEVSVMVNGKTPFVGKVVDLDGQGHLGYDIHVDKGLLHEGKNTFDVSIKVTDDAGNEITVHDGHEVQMDTQLAATITLDPVATNNVVNAAAIDHVSVTGMVGTDADAHVGDKVTVTVNGTEFKGDVVDVDGKGHLGYDIHVDKALLHENDNTIKVSVDAKDAAGNTITVDEEHIVHVDTQLDATITLDPVAANNVVNAAAIDHVSVTGTVGTDADAHVGDKVTVTVNGTEFKGDVIDVDGKGHLGYDIHVDKALLHENDNTIKVSVDAKDAAGNTVTVHEEHIVHVDTQLDATITLEPVAANNVVNAAAIDHVSVTGMVGTDADAHVGDKVTVTVNGTDFKGDVVDVDGKGQLGYNIHVDKALLHENDNTIKVSVDAKDAAGNTVTVHEEHHVLVDTQVRAAIHLDNVAGNNVINAKEVDHVSVTGTVDRDSDAQLGDHVTVTINHQSFTGVVSVINGHLGYDIPVDKGYLQDGKNTFDVSINATDKAGNAITVHDSHDVLVDTHADAKITIDKVTGDNHIDSQEARHHVTHITGQIDSADVHNNEHINVTVNDKHYDVVLHEDNGHLTYDLPVNTHELNVGKNHVDVSVTANDDHGNTNVIHQNADFTMDDPAHRGKHDVDTGGKEHHGAHGHDNGLSNLFGDSHDTLSFDLRPDSKGHHGDADPKVFTGKDDSQHEKIDLTSLAKELHENPDITHYIKGGDEHGHGKGLASAATHTPGVSHPGDATAMHDSGGSSHYSVDHLIAKPEHYSH
ncbi:Ig-like domain-containing protein [Buttiauxella brennerae]|uniref:Ig-like domain-containing protein n=1 Tax=Buttiauxella brennerae TaxID=82988 RepID=UPI001AE0CF58|nr:Ig-like domain-containing protein [Buttiauxella brennerae]